MFTLYNPTTNITIRGIHFNYVERWKRMGFFAVDFFPYTRHVA